MKRVSDEAPRLGVVLSAGGAAFCAAAKIAQGLDINFSVVVDRACGAEDACRGLGLETTRIVEPSREAFSRRLEHHFSRSFSPNCVVPFFPTDRVFSVRKNPLP